MKIADTDWLSLNMRDNKKRETSLTLPSTDLNNTQFATL
jgi:hypothetical protein